MIRVSLALVALLALTAFAPAPFPKSHPNHRGSQRDTAISLARFQGTWKVISFERFDLGGQRTEWKDWGLTEVRVEYDIWTYIQRDGRVHPIIYEVDVGKSKGSASIDLIPKKRGDGHSCLLGLIRRDGDRVELLMAAGVKKEDRPKRFDDPRAGWWLLTLHRR
jgi:uncharacterized protein (TIGR03067 family)